MYFSTPDVDVAMSKSLHSTLASSVHVLVHSERPEKDWMLCGVQWSVFLPDDVPALCEYLQGRHANRKVHVSNLHQYCLDYDEGALLLQKGVRPFNFFQKPGHAVYIPAGCAYQVSVLPTERDTRCTERQWGSMTDRESHLDYTVCYRIR